MCSEGMQCTTRCKQRAVHYVFNGNKDTGRSIIAIDLPVWFIGIMNGERWSLGVLIHLALAALHDLSVVGEGFPSSRFLLRLH